ncbi:MAG: condensation domain-containing protein, partial [Bordetella sp.]|nr:condensation domain-containing protein [Bordetella sp.]
MDDTLARQIAAKFASLGPAQRRAVYAKMREQGLDPTALPILPAQGEPVLSHAQERLWFLWRLAPEDASYHLPGVLRLRGALDEAGVRAAFDALAQRHEALRTHFAMDALGMGRPVVEARASIGLQVADLRAAGARAHDDAQALMAGWVAAPFDLLAGPLLRVGLIRVADDETLLVTVMHHIVSDGWSMGLLLEDFTRAYEAWTHGEPLAEVTPPLRYADYAAWQRALLEAGERDRQEAYWRGALDVSQPRLSLAAGGGAGQAPYAAATLPLTLPAPLAAELRREAQRRGTTVFVLLLAAFQALMARHGGQDDLNVGIPVAGRGRGELQAMVGLFVNTQVLRAQLSPDMRWEDLLAQTRAGWLAAQAHQELPFDQLVDALQPARAAGETPLFQVLFNHQSLPARPDWRVAGLPCEAVALAAPTLPFTLQCDTLEYDDGGIRVLLRYASEALGAPRMARLGQGFLSLLQAMVAQPDARVYDAPLLDACEAARLAGWERGAPLAAGADWAGEAVHVRIAAQARENPDRIALRVGDETLSYAELDARANALAHELVAEGAGPERVVAIIAHR